MEWDGTGDGGGRRRGTGAQGPLTEDHRPLSTESTCEKSPEPCLSRNNCTLKGGCDILPGTTYVTP